MAAGKQLQPIIVKRVKKGGHAVHGGAWKIAYADFVTAMMAFFLLMWLLGSTAKGDLNGIAEYFQSPLKVAMAGGDGTGNSDSILPGGGRDLSRSAGQVDGGDAERAAKVLGAQLAKAEQRRQDEVRIDRLQKRIQNLITSKPALQEFGDQVRIEKVPDGLHIQIVDELNRPMFASGSALVQPYMRDILREIGGALGDVENRIVLAGHTDATPYGSGVIGYSNWELSADRANASRRELVSGGLPDEKLMRVQGMAASYPLEPADPQSPVNRRISIVILTREAEDRLNQTFAPPGGPPVQPQIPPVEVVPTLAPPPVEVVPTTPALNVPRPVPTAG